MSVKDERFEIELQYTCQRSPASTAVYLRASEYFDSEFYTDDQTALLSVPNYQRVCDYVNTVGEISGTRLRIHDKQSGAVRTLVSSYWNGGQSELVEVRQSGSGVVEDVHELILTQQLTVGDKHGWLIERWDWRNDFWQPTSCSFVEQLPNGAQEDHPISV